MALLGFYYGFTPADILEFNDEQIDMYLSYIPDLQARKDLQVAQLEATMRNALGGKKKSGPSTPANLLYTAFELLNAFARAKWLVKLLDPGGPKQDFACTPGQARALLQAVKEARLPSWCKQMLDKTAPLDVLKRIARDA